MIKSLTLAGLAVLASLSMAQAADAVKPVMAAPVKAAMPRKERTPGPCKPVFDACKAAGFTRGDHTNGKGIIADCVKPLEDGKAVPGVTVGKPQIDACKADYQARKAKFDDKMKTDPEFAKKMTERKAQWEAKKAEKLKALDAATTPTIPAAK